MFTTTASQMDLQIDCLRYVPDFIETERQHSLLEYIDSQTDWVEDSGVYSRFRRSSESGNTAPRRRKLCRGGLYEPEKRQIAQRLGPLPPILSGLAKDLFAAGLMSELADQAIVNEYLPGQGIAAHADARCFKDSIVSLSLGSGCVMRFRRKAEARCADLYLAPGSVLAISGPARWRWTHEIAKRKYDVVDGLRVVRGVRYSITFRTMVDTAG